VSFDRQAAERIRASARVVLRHPLAQPWHKVLVMPTDVLDVVDALEETEGENERLRDRLNAAERQGERLEERVRERYEEFKSSRGHYVSEADRVFDQGFKEALRWVLEEIHGERDER
jgi:predicted nuclease with TOPRIM domain